MRRPVQQRPSRARVSPSGTTWLVDDDAGNVLIAQGRDSIVIALPTARWLAGQLLELATAPAPAIGRSHR